MGIGRHLTLEEILDYKQATSALYSPVGWLKCSGCAFYDYCWPQAEKNGLGGKDVRGWHDKIPKTKVISLRRT